MTGGGSPSIILDAFEEKILSVIGDAAVTGIKSGVDTEEVTVTLELLPVVSASTLDLAEEREVGKITGFDVEDLAVDVGFWFKASTKRKNILDDEKQARCVRLREVFQDPMSEIHLLFYQSTDNIYTFQPALPGKTLIRFFIKKLLSKFLKPGAFRGVNVDTVDLRDEESQLPDSQLGVGFTTRTTLNRLVEAGDISKDSAKKFHVAARSFFVKAVEYATAKLPLHDPVLEHSRFVDLRQKMDTSLDDVLYFVHRFNHLLPYNQPREQDQLNDEFLEYQMMEEEDIPASGQTRMGSTTGWTVYGDTLEV
ncbi:hypothetical protein DPX16_0210 [Anabarilius grahami]|uniref:Uncharacterized protein n=1 Tax=Anabarilius grahami TaxID=495550 RepID=A0A3N0Y549_ANAGA|nr:hypothetical protein DPX16_0210 [Anabarilius grahami]